jgi:hypothetical protein
MNKYQKCLTAGALVIASVVTSGFAAPAIAKHDGNWWRTQQKQAKTAYVIGQMDGVCVVMAAEMREFQSDATPLTIAKQRFASVNIEQVVLEMDRFYSEARNRAIPTTELLFKSTLSALKKEKQ